MPDLSFETLKILPLARAETIPSSWYVDEGFHRLDRRLLFSDSWQYVGPASDLAEEGAYRADTVAGEPIVVVRDKENRLRAWYNVCRHRGGPLVTDTCGTARMLQCKYHGWTYKLDGSLRGVPRFDRTDLFDKRDFGLTPLQVTEWQGMVFVNLGRGGSIEETVRGITDRIAPLDLSQMRFERRDLYDVACNWKVYVDNYLEGYHLPIVHPELCDLLDYRNYVTETYPTYSLQYSPLQEGDNIYGTPSGDAFYYFVFPNLMLNILPHRLQVNRIVPVTRDRCRVIFDYYYVRGTDASMIKDDAEFSDRVQMEDVEICEHVQRGLESRAYDQGRFSADAEPGVYHFQCMLKAAYRTALEETTVDRA
ncbi:MAG: aromatic ring-hydroxylating dioxygenase subunit alpha [Rhodothermales bacterium]|nr:aromatic ring-hydroxylating dioxygenase subunit alpha [Rhodothermales bacterium]